MFCNAAAQRESTTMGGIIDWIGPANSFSVFIVCRADRDFFFVGLFEPRNILLLFNKLFKEPLLFASVLFFSIAPGAHRRLAHSEFVVNRFKKC